MANNQKNDDFESRRIYPIPENFADGTGVFGGMFPLRNFVEGVLFALPALLFALALSSHFGLGINAKIPIVIFSVSPGLILGCIGINGDSVTEFLAYYFRFRKKRRVARYNPRVKLEFTGDIMVNQNEVPIDKIKRMLVNLSQKDRQDNTETDRYFAVGRNVAFEDDIALEKRLAAKAERSAGRNGRKGKKTRC